VIGQTKRSSGGATAHHAAAPLMALGPGERRGMGSATVRELDNHVVLTRSVVHRSHEAGAARGSAIARPTPRAIASP
jgi:hypothetical protein